MLKCASIQLHGFEHGFGFNTGCEITLLLRDFCFKTGREIAVLLCGFGFNTGCEISFLLRALGLDDARTLCCELRHHLTIRLGALQCLTACSTGFVAGVVLFPLCRRHIWEWFSQYASSGVDLRQYAYTTNLQSLVSL